MSSLTFAEKRIFEKILNMESGYVLDFSDASFKNFVFDSVFIQIDDEKYHQNGSSKAKRLRCFWDIEEDHIVAKLLNSILSYIENDYIGSFEFDSVELKKAKDILLKISGKPISFEPLKTAAEKLDAKYLSEQITRIEKSIQEDPALAIGTAKELIETVCKTILNEYGISLSGNEDIPKIVKLTLGQLKLLPSDIPDSAKGSAEIRKILNNLSSVACTLAELRNLYGTGHGKDGKAIGLQPRHAKLAVSSAVTMVNFLFETYEERNNE